MSGIVGDILGPAAAGLGGGISQGIKDYGEIQKGIVAGAQADEVMQRQKHLNETWEPMKNPDIKNLYDSMDDQHKSYIDSKLKTYADSSPDGRLTNRHMEQLKQDMGSEQQTFEAVRNGIINQSTNEVNKLRADHLALTNQLTEMPVLITQKDAKGNVVQVENPEYLKGMEAMKASKVNLDKKQEQVNVLANKTELMSKQVSIKEAYLNNRAFFDNSPAAKTILDLAYQQGDNAAVEKVVDLLAKSKDPKITNRVEAYIAGELQHGNTDLRAITKGIEQMEKNIAAAKEKAVQSAKPAVTDNYEVTYKNGQKETIALIRKPDGLYNAVTDKKIDEDKVKDVQKKGVSSKGQKLSLGDLKSSSKTVMTETDARAKLADKGYNKEQIEKYITDYKTEGLVK